MRDYELVVVFDSRLGDEEVETAIGRVNKWIGDLGGNLVKAEKWGRKKLAYPIKHLWEGNYVFTEFQGEPRRMAELEANLKLSEDVIRFLLVNKGD